MTEKEELLEAYRRELHNIAVARDPLAAEKAMCKARVYVGELKHNHKLGEKDSFPQPTPPRLAAWTPVLCSRLSLWESFSQDTGSCSFSANTCAL